MFKGGTSLSRVYGLIDRYSEDIDLLVIFPDEGGGSSENERDKLLKGIQAEVHQHFGADDVRQELLRSTTSAVDQRREARYQVPLPVTRNGSHSTDRRGDPRKLHLVESDRAQIRRRGGVGCAVRPCRGHRWVVSGVHQPGMPLPGMPGGGMSCSGAGSGSGGVPGFAPSIGPYMLGGDPHTALPGWAAFAGSVGQGTG